MRSIVRITGVASLALMLGACAALTGDEEDTRDGAQVEDRGAPAAEDTRDGAATGAVGDGGQFQGHPLDDPESPLSERLVHFDFDSSDIKPEYDDMLLAHARYLAENADTNVVLEGHTDERGSREYNIGLGERRAQSVRRFLLLEGAREGQVETVSYGEEKPMAGGHNEEAWAKNRRVEIVYPEHDE